MNGFSKFSLLQSILAKILQSADKIYSFFLEISGEIQFGRKKNRNSFPSAPTVFEGVKIVQQINLRFLSFFD